MDDEHQGQKYVWRTSRTLLSLPGPVGPSDNDYRPMNRPVHLGYPWQDRDDCLWGVAADGQ